jgi:lipopolysaccharide export system protein LptA
MIAYRMFFGLALGIIIASGWTQQKPTPPSKSQTSKQTDKDTDILDVSFGTIKISDYNGEHEYTTFVAVDKDTVISGDLCKVHDKKKTAEATGNLKMADPQADATGEKAVVYYAKGKKTLTILGSVQITVKPKDKSGKTGEAGVSSGAQSKSIDPAPVKVEGNKASVQQETKDNDDESARKYPAIITCDKFEYQYAKDKKHGILTGNFKVVQKLPKKTRTLTAEHGEWFGKEEKIILYPPVHFEDTDGTNFDPKGEVTVITKEGEESVSAAQGGKGQIVVKDEEEDKKKTGNGKKPQ